MNKNIPNLISILRIFISIFMLFFIGNSIIFYVLFFLACFSDFLDGYLARKYQISSKLGAIIDSVSDLVFVMILLCVFYFKFKIIVIELWIQIVIIAVIRIFNIILGLIKFKQLVMYHTVFNKITGVLLLMALPILDLIKIKGYIWILITVALFTAVEESIIMIRTKKVDLDEKGLFWRKTNKK